MITKSQLIEELFVEISAAWHIIRVTYKPFYNLMDVAKHLTKNIWLSIQCFSQKNLSTGLVTELKTPRETIFAYHYDNRTTSSYVTDMLHRKQSCNCNNQSSTHLMHFAIKLQITKETDDLPFPFTSA